MFLKDLLEGNVFQSGKGQVVVVIPPDEINSIFKNTLHKIRNKIKNNIYLSVNKKYSGNDKTRFVALKALSLSLSLPLVATNDVQTHLPERKILHDVLTCIR